MLVRMWMTERVKTVSPDTPILEALHLMKAHHFRRLPVLDKKGVLIGLVTENDILSAAPPHKKKSSVWEINEQLAQMTVKKIMTLGENLVTISPEEPIEEAALLMRRHKVGSLLVLQNEKLVGIITESDVLQVMMELMGVQHTGVRLTLEILNRPGALTRVLDILKEHRANILSIVTCRHCSESPRHGVIVVRMEVADQQALLAELNDEDIDILDVRETLKNTTN
jgi:acetoin utilization protein AcuB